MQIFQDTFYNFFPDTPLHRSKCTVFIEIFVNSAKVLALDFTFYSMSLKASTLKA